MPTGRRSRSSSSSARLLCLPIYFRRASSASLRAFSRAAPGRPHGRSPHPAHPDAGRLRRDRHPGLPADAVIGKHLESLTLMALVPAGRRRRDVVVDVLQRAQRQRVARGQPHRAIGADERSPRRSGSAPARSWPRCSRALAVDGHDHRRRAGRHEPPRRARVLVLPLDADDGGGDALRSAAIAAPRPGRAAPRHARRRPRLGRRSPSASSSPSSSPTPSSPGS